MFRHFVRLALALLWGAVLHAQSDILLITMDTTRADHLSCYGYDRKTSPFLDAFAGGAVRFSRAYTPVPITLPSHTTMMTGLWPRDHGVRDNMLQPLPADVPTAATLLKVAGYRTAAFVSSYVLDHRFGLDRGFDRYDDHMTFNARAEDETVERLGEETSHAVAEYLGGLSPGPPLFLWVHFYDPHHPYLAHADTPAGMGGYDGEIRHMDQAVGLVLEAWKRAHRGLILIVGDHGESLGEHGEPYHGVFLYEAVVHVPLLLDAGGSSAPGVDARWVSTTDILPTLLDFAGIPASPRPGSSLLKPGLRHERLYFESLLPANSFGWTPPFAVLSPPYVFIQLPKPELYDIVADGAETRNLANRRRSEARTLLNRLRNEYTTTPPAGPLSPDPEAARKLEALGYRGGSTAHSGRDPKDLIWVVAEMDRGVALEAKKDYPGAEAVCRKILAANPENYQTLVRLGSLLKLQGRRGEARTVFQQALRTNPAYVHAHFNLAAMEFEDGNFEAARKEFEAVLALNPDSAESLYYLLRIALNADNMVKARTLLQQAEKRDPDGPNRYFYGGLISAKGGDLASAARQFSECLKRNPDYVDAEVNLAQAYFGLGRVDDSIQAYRKALDMDADRPGVYLTLGSILLNSRNDAQGALRLFRMFLDRYPHHAEADKVRDMVRDLSRVAP